MELPDNLKWISDVDGIDPEEGIKNCGKPEQYIKFIRTFHDTLENRIHDIKDALISGDIDTYTIKVHSLKSTARIMGAKELSKLAEELENAGDNGDRNIIDKNTSRLLGMCATFKEKLSPITDVMEKCRANSGDKPAISPEDLSNAYEAIRDFVPQMDYDAVEMVLSELKEYTLPEKDREKCDRLEKLLRNFDWEGMEAEVSSL